MSTLTELSQNLLQIKLKFTQHPVFLKGRGVGVDDPSFTRNVEDLDVLSKRLAILIRELKSAQNLWSARGKTLTKIPRENQFGANSSILQRQTEAPQLIQDARKVNELIEEAIYKNGLLSADDAAENMSQLIVKTYIQLTNSQHSGEHEAILLPAGTSQISPTQLQGSSEAAVLAMYVAVRVFVQLCCKKYKR